MPFTPGLVTVTFRQLSPRRIVDLAQEAGLAALEWGGDIHVPVRDLDRAAEVGRMTLDAGLGVACYGSYVRLGEDDPATFPRVILTATALGAPCVRVWAGRRASADADDGYRRRVADAALQLAELAEGAGLTIAYEYHQNTLTDTDASAAALLAATDHPAVRTLWQPRIDDPVDRACESLRAVLPRLAHVHAYHWPRRGERAPLAQGADRWRAYLDVLRENGKECPVLLEFVANDDPDQLRADAATLHEWLAA